MNDPTAPQFQIAAVQQPWAPPVWLRRTLAWFGWVRVSFCDVVVISDRDGVPCLSVRVACHGGATVVQPRMTMVLVRTDSTVEGEPVRSMTDLDLVRDTCPILPLSWTVVHRITEQSPLYGRCLEDLLDADAVVLCALVGQTEGAAVSASRSYKPDSLLYGRRFVDVIVRTPEGRLAVDLGRLHQTREWVLSGELMGVGPDDCPGSAAR